MRLKRGLIVIACIVLLYVLGPKVAQSNFSPEIDTLSVKLSEVDSLVREKNKNPIIKPDNQSKIYWADSIGKKTTYVLLYLHGFSACPMEGDPVYSEFAKKYKMNAYAPLLAENGLREKEAMINFTGKKYLESAKEALSIAQAMGDSVIIMSTSTGSTAALFLASAENKIHSLICYSPNIRVYDSRAFLLTGPWGLQIARLVKGGKYHSWEAPEEAKPYWHTKYRLEAVLELQHLLESTMNNDVFSKITIPVLVTYYFEDEEYQDKVVSVSEIIAMTKNLGTESKKLSVLNIKEAKVHAMASGIFNENTERVLNETCKFANEVLYLDK